MRVRGVALLADNPLRQAAWRPTPGRTVIPWLTSVAAALLLCAFPSPALANGGTVQIANQRAGPYSVTVFTSPNPTPVGIVDISVLLQRAGSQQLVEDAHVTVSADPIGNAGHADTFLATHADATNKLYYAANVNLTAEGQWRLTVHIDGPPGQADTVFTLQASQSNVPLQLEAWGLGIIPLALLAYLVVARVSRRRRPSAIKKTR